MLVELGLRERALVVFNQEFQEVERLGRERYGVAAVREQPAIGVERPRIKAETQN